MSGYSYIRVRWRHNNANYPIDMWSELDEERYEVRKVEVWADGRIGYADEKDQKISELGEHPVPLSQEIAEDPQFELIEISPPDFESRWNSRKG